MSYLKHFFRLGNKIGDTKIKEIRNIFKLKK